MQTRLDELVRPVAPPERLAAVRLFVGTFAVIYLFARVVALLRVAHHDPLDFDPAGFARLSGPVPAWLVYVSVALTLAASIPFLAGIHFRVTGPLFAVLLTWILSYRNSFGMIFHTENLLVMHVAVLSLTDSAAAYSWDAKRRGAKPDPARRFGFGLQCVGLVTTLAYVLAGVAKLRTSGMGWAAGEILRNHIAHDNLRKLLLGDSYSRIGAWAAQHGWIFKPLAVVTLLVELLAPLALLRGPFAKVWVLFVWGFHAGVLVLMWILFPYQLFFVAFASFFDAERPIERTLAFVRRKRAAQSGVVA